MKTAFRFKKIAILSLICFSFLLLDSCTFYHRIDIQDKGKGSWHEALNAKSSRPANNIKIQNGQYQYELRNYTIEDKVVTGELVKIQGFPIPEEKIFRSGKIPSSQRKVFQRTLYVVSDGPLEEGSLSINIDDINMLNRYQTEYVTSILANGAIGLGVLVAGTAIFVAIACNCPRVYALDSDGNEHLQGPLFTGAIAKSFERRDLLPIKDIDQNMEEVVLKVVNELPEDEFINELKLFKTTHQADYQIGMDASEELFEFKTLTTPDEAVSINGWDLTEKVNEADDLFYEFEDDTYLEELNSAIFTFNKPQNARAKIKLVIHGRQTQWLEQVTESFFRLYGTDFDKINKRIDKIPISLYNRNMARNGISMNAYIMTKNGWSKLGVFKNAGTVKKLFLGMDLDLSQIKGEKIKIKLEAAFRFWELDQIGITQDWKMLNNYEEVPLKSAINEVGDDVSALIQSVDNQYVVQADNGTFIELTYDNQLNDSEIYVLQGTGYYHHKRNYTHKPENKAIRAIKSKGKLAAHELSILLHDYTRAMTLTGH